MMVMPFGKYRGTPVSDLPEQYVEWCLGNLDDLDPVICRAMKHRLSVVKGHRRRAASMPFSQSPLFSADFESMVEEWYRRASVKYHPSFGGSDEGLSVVNDCYETLIGKLREASADGKLTA